MFWGILAIAVPIILHFWHQKRGKLLPWAATQWLSEKAMQQSRGIQLENILLLCLRVLLLLLFILFLANLLLNQSSGNKVKSHWVYPQKSLVENFKFELEEAKRKGEKLFWLNGEEIENFEEIPDKTEIQTGINQIAAHLKGNEHGEIFVPNTSELTGFSKVFVPVDYTLHIFKDSSKAVSQDYIQLENGKKLGIDKNRLFGEVEGSRNLVHSGSVAVLDETEENGVDASLKAIEKVYGIEFEIDKKREPNKKYDLVFLNNLQGIQTTDVTIFISDAKKVQEKVLSENIAYFNGKLTPESSELVFNGGLPELILEKWLNRVGIKGTTSSVSNQQISSLFSVKEMEKKSESQWLIFILFLGVLGWERWLAIKKNT